MLSRCRLKLHGLFILSHFANQPPRLRLFCEDKRHILSRPKSFQLRHYTTNACSFLICAVLSIFVSHENIVHRTELFSLSIVTSLCSVVNYTQPVFIRCTFMSTTYNSVASFNGCVSTNFRLVYWVNLDRRNILQGPKGEVVLSK